MVYFGFVIRYQFLIVALPKVNRPVFQLLQFLDRSRPVQLDQTPAIGFQVAVLAAIAHPALGVDIDFVPPCRQVRSSDIMAGVAGVVSYQRPATDAAADTVRAVPSSDVAAEYLVQRLNQFRHREDIAAAAPT